MSKIEGWKTELAIMTKMLEEQISALLDGELPLEQEALLLRRLEQNGELRNSLGRFSMIGELMRDANSDITALSVSGRVAAAIRGDSQVEQPLQPATRWSSGLIGAGFAASIAVLVMFNLNRLTGPVAQAGSPAIPVAQAVQADHATDNSARMMRYMVSHSRFANSASRQLQDAHFAMSTHHSPGDWSENE